ncbi:MAG: ribonuclease H [Tepidibacillus sp.]
MNIEKYEVYTDGACANNQAAGGQPGGWGAVFLDGRQFSGGEISTTNNRMELTAAIEALKNTPKGSKVKIYSDSAYLINAFQQNWLKSWIKKGWITSQGKPVENQDLWKQLLPLVEERVVEWEKVKGHSGNKWNEMADQIAVAAIPSSKSPKSEKIDKKKTITLSYQNYELLVDTIQKLADKDERFQYLYQEIK